MKRKKILLQNFAAFSRHLISSSLFVLILVVLDIGSTLCLANTIPVRLGIMLENAGLGRILIPFVLRALAGFSLVALVFAGLLSAFRVTRRWLFYSFVTGYVVLYNLLNSPQLFDEFSAAERLIKQILVLLRPLHLHLFTATFLCFLLLSWFERERKSPRSIAGRLAATGATLFLSYFFFFAQPLSVVQNHAAFAKAFSAVPQRAAGAKNIIILSVDSALSDRLDDADRGDAFPVFRGFLKSSFRFKQMITPVAQTHAAFTALFTGNSPLKTQIRENLPAGALDTQKMLEGSIVESFKKAGYETSFLMDSREYAYFDAGNAFDKITGPEAGIKHLLLPSVFRSRLFFALLNNPIGFFFLPEIRFNSSFDGYNPGYFTQEVISRLRDISKDASAPHLLIAHTCLLHWPGSYTYPYYPQQGYYDDSRSQYSYISRRDFFRPFISRTDRKRSILFNHEIYNHGILMAKEQFLEPIFSELENDGLLKNAAIVVISDHGENLWDPESLYPVTYIPSHGTSLIFGAQAERAALHLKLPDHAGQDIDRNVGVTDLLPTLAEWAGVKIGAVDGRSFLRELLGKSPWPSWRRDYYSENGSWTKSMFQGQLVFAATEYLYTFFGMQAGTGRVFVEPAHDAAIVDQKQRAIIRDNLRFSIYPTVYGYQAFLCNFEQDRYCRENLYWKVSPLALNDLLSSFNSMTKLDQTRQQLAPLVLEPSVVARSNLLATTIRFGEIVEHMGSTKPELVTLARLESYRAANELAYRQGDIELSTRLINGLTEDKQTPDYLRQMAIELALEICKSGNYAAATIPTSIKDLLSALHQDGWRGDEGSFSLPKLERDTALCGHILSPEKETAEFSKIFTPANVEATSGDLQMYPFSHQQLESLLKLYGVDSSRGRQILARLSAESSNSGEAEKYLTLADKKPNSTHDIRELRWAKTIQLAKGDASVVKSKVSSDLYEEHQYGLFEELEVYDGLTFSAQAAVNPRSALLLAAERLNSETVPLRHFHQLIDYIDQITNWREKAGFRISELNEQALALEQPEKPRAHAIEFNALKTALALGAVARFLCADARASTECGTAHKMVVENSTATAFEKIYERHASRWHDSRLGQDSNADPAALSRERSPLTRAFISQIIKIGQGGAKSIE